MNLLLRSQTYREPIWRKWATGRPNWISRERV